LEIKHGCLNFLFNGISKQVFFGSITIEVEQ